MPQGGGDGGGGGGGGGDGDGNAAEMLTNYESYSSAFALDKDPNDAIMAYAATTQANATAAQAAVERARTARKSAVDAIRDDFKFAMGLSAAKTAIRV